MRSNTKSEVQVEDIGPHLGWWETPKSIVFHQSGNLVFISDKLGSDRKDWELEVGWGWGWERSRHESY